MEVVHGGKFIFSPLSNSEKGEQECTDNDAPLCVSGSSVFKPAVELVDDAMRAAGGGGSIAAGEGAGDSAAVGGAAAA